jgi:hypothetical protein
VAPRRVATPARKAETPAPAADGDDVEVRFDPVTDAAAADENDDGQAFVDGSEQEHRHLSKAERKRLKKLARMNRSVA